MQRPHRKATDLFALARKKLRHLRLDMASTCDNFAQFVWHSPDFRDFEGIADGDFIAMIQCGFCPKSAQPRIDKRQEIQRLVHRREIIDISIDSNLALMSSKGGRLPNEITYTF